MSGKMRVLVACEESQEVCKAFRRLGHEAYSCDIQEPSGGHPEWHILGDALVSIQGGRLYTMDGQPHDIPAWDLIIAHPPCTYLTDAANRVYSLRVTPPDKVVARMKKREEAIVFFMQFALANCDRVAVENPKGRISTVWRPPDQYIDPYMFAASTEDTENYVCKRTGLWLRGLPKLRGNGLPKPEPKSTRIQTTTGRKKTNTWTEGCKTQGGMDRSKIRSKTFPGIARAMAEQWGGDARTENRT